MRAVLSLGSNMADSRQLLRHAVADFAASGELVSCSQLYRTPPWGGVAQDDFYNLTAIVDTAADPWELLRRGQQLEAAAHRERTQRWGPRTLDIDIIDYQDFSSSDPLLTVPHPYAHQRAFVLVPWYEIDPDATLAGTALSELIAQLDPKDVAAVRPAGKLD